MPISKKVVLIFGLIYYCIAAQAQQFEWYNTVLPKGQLGNVAFIPGTVTSISNKIVLSSTTTAKELSLFGSIPTILTATNILPDAYFLSFDDKGNLENSQIINTPNGNDGTARLCYNKSNGFIYVSFATTSDSVRFTNTMPWIKVNRKNANTYNAFIVIYDNLFNYVSYIPCVSYNGCQVRVNTIDNAGNIYLGGTYKDSLMFNGKLLLKNTSIYSASFIMKVDNSNNVQWINENGGLFYLNETRNSFYLLGGVGKNSDAVIKYNKTDSLIFSSNSNNRTILAEFSAKSGQLKQYIIIYDGAGNEFVTTEMKGNDKTLLLNRYTTSTGLTKLKIGADSFTITLSSQYGNNFIMGFNASDLKNKFVNFFDSSVYKLYITNIYNDSLYSIIGTSGGNQNFGFNGENIFTKDYIKKRPISYYFPSDFYSTYTTTNRLKDLWYITTHPTLASQTFYNQDMQKGILADNGNIYLTGTVSNHSEFGLGKREFSYAGGGSRSLTLLKYNCKPTSFFSYTLADNKVTFKNLSTGLINYTWLFGKDNDKTTTKDATYDYPKTGGVFYPMLIASNSCGSDTFMVAITIGASSVSKLNKINVSVYPNPVNSKIMVQFDNELNMKNLQFFLYDMCGKYLVCPFIKTDETHFEIDIENIANGIYSLVIQNDEYNLSKKITILK